MSEDLSKKISELRHEVEQLKFQNPTDKQHLEGLVSEIEQAEKQSAEENDSLIKHISSSIEQFEVEHPRATAILNDIMVSLSNMGI